MVRKVHNRHQSFRQSSAFLQLQEIPAATPTNFPSRSKTTNRGAKMDRAIAIGPTMKKKKNASLSNDRNHAAVKILLVLVCFNQGTMFSS
jgi:hypothetical protein